MPQWKRENAFPENAISVCVLNRFSNHERRIINKQIFFLYHFGVKNVQTSVRRSTDIHKVLRMAVIQLDAPLDTPMSRGAPRMCNPLKCPLK